MRQPATRELFDYWNKLRRGRAQPDRMDVDIAEIRGVLADIFMLDVDAGHRFPFVMSGSRVNALFCDEQNGRSFLDLWPRLHVHNIAAVLMTVVDASCPIIAAATAKPEGYREADLEILLLPLRNNGQGQARILGLIAASTKPTWLGLLSPEHLSLRSLRAIDEVSPRGTVGETLFSALPLPRRNSPEIRGHLRVFQGGK